MNKPDKETLRRILLKMHKQSDYEKFTGLLAVSSCGMRMKVSFRTVEFSTDTSSDTFFLPMKNIHSVTQEKDKVYILCYNQTLHVIDLKEQDHLLIPLRAPLSLREMFFLMCRSYCDRFRMRI